MKYIAILWVLVVVGCGIFNPGDDYNPNYTPKPVAPVVEAPKDSVKVDTITLTNGIDTIQMLVVDTLKWPVPIDTLKNE